MFVYAWSTVVQHTFATLNAMKTYHSPRLHQCLPASALASHLVELKLNAIAIQKAQSLH